VNWKDLTIKEIETFLATEGVNEEVVDALLKDERAGVVSLARKYQRLIEREKEKINRWKQFARTEERLREKGYSLIAGIDEAGRGPLAGPVVAAAVILDPEQTIIGLDDSKKLTEEEREELFEIISEKALAIGIGIIDNKTIDRVNILQATFKAMQEALKKINPSPDYVLVDGNREIPDLNFEQENIIDGDSRVNAIAAASVIAKVTRDRMLVEYHQEYPVYGFASNKGYGTGEHIRALEKYGPCPLHRFTYSIVSKSYFLHIREKITRAESDQELKKLGEIIARRGFFSEEYLGVLRELYRKRYYKIVSG